MNGRGNVQANELSCGRTDGTSDAYSFRLDSTYSCSASDMLVSRHADPATRIAPPRDGEIGFTIVGGFLGAVIASPIMLAMKLGFVDLYISIAGPSIIGALVGIMLGGIADGFIAVEDDKPVPVKRE